MPGTTAFNDPTKTPGGGHPLPAATAVTTSHHSIRNCVFYFDLSLEQNHCHASFSYILPRIATFLDKNVTHFVTDKASTIVEAHSSTLKWKMTVWSLSQFLPILISIMERSNDTASLSLIKRDCKVKSRDLNQCLEEERRTSKLKPARMTPLYAAAGANGTNPAATTANLGIVNGAAAGGKITTAVKPTSGQKSKHSAHFLAFTSPYILIEEGDLFCAPIHKQYPPMPSGRVTFPVIKFESLPPHCPFSYATRPRVDNKYWSELKTDPEHARRANRAALAAAAAAVNEVPSKEDAKNKSAKPSNKRTSFGGDPAKRQSYLPKNKPGYCECCNEKYEILRTHVQSEKHRAFAGTGEKYSVVDQILRRISRPSVFDYNPILVWGASKATQAAHMSPAHSTIQSICTKKSGNSALRANHTPLPPTVEDKENDSPSGLDLTGLDKGYLAEKRRIMSNSSDVFQHADPIRRKAARLSATALSKIKF